MNILKLQDGLKNLSDEQLAQEMRLPSGSTPQYLIMTEMQRREKMRAEFSGSEPPKTTMAEEMSGEAPPPQGGMPPGGQDANAQGLMGMPDETMAGNAMRARISGQPQQIDGMTALPPQAMAVGGAVQFGNPFAGAQMGSAPSSTGYAPIQRYTYTAPPPPPAPDYTSMLRGLGFNPRGAARPAKPPVVQKPPVGTAVPVRGRPAQNRGPIRRAADGGPIYAADGLFTGFDDGPTNQMSDYDLQRAASSSDPELRITALDEMKRRNSMSVAGRLDAQLGRGGKQAIDLLGSGAELYYRAPGRLLAGVANNVGDAVSYLAGKGTQLAPSYVSERGNGQVPTPPDISAIPEVSDAPAQAAPGANAPELPLGGLVPPSTDYASLNMPTDRSAAPPSASVSGLPSLPNLRPSGGGIASLPKPEKDSSYEDYMKQANALLAEAGGDPAADKDRSFNNALMKLGLGMAASKNQSILGAAAEGGIPALEQYTSDEAQRRKDARAMAGDKLTVLGSGMQMRQSAEKDYRDQINKAEELRQRGMESEARMLEAEATSRFRMAELGIRGAELESARQDRLSDRDLKNQTLAEAIRSNKANEEKLPETVRAAQAQYGDKWQVALKAQSYQDNLEKYTASYKAALANSSLEDAKYFKEKMDTTISNLERAMNELYGSDSSNTGTQIRRVDANGNPIQ